MTQSENIPVKKDNGNRTTMHPLMNLREEIEHIFDNFMGGRPSLRRWMDFDPFKDMGRLNAGLSPVVDISETDNGYEMTAELPGVDVKDIDVSLADNVLTLKAEKKAAREEKKKDYYLNERSYGSLQRSFTLPSDADSAKINTEFSKGVLTITVPKSAEAKAKVRKIQVKGG